MVAMPLQAGPVGGQADGSPHEAGRRNLVLLATRAGHTSRLGPECWPQPPRKTPPRFRATSRRSAAPVPGKPLVEAPGRPNAGRHPRRWRRERATIATGNPHNPDRICGNRRSGRQRICQKLGEARWQRYWISF
jgi:hypothetical protein